MLQFTHDGQTIEVDLEKLPLHEGLALQKATGMRLPEFLEAVKSFDMEALAALGWMLVKHRCGKADVTFEDVCEGRVAVTIADFVDTEAEARQAAADAEGNGESPPRKRGGVKTRT
ncbi:hypothetical protein [Nonomuraea sp. NPDC002799]